MAYKLPASSKCRGLYDTFIMMFPQYKDVVRLYGPMDRSSIRIETTDHRTYVFTWIDERNWALQTMKNYGGAA